MAEVDRLGDRSLGFVFRFEPSTSSSSPSLFLILTFVLTVSSSPFSLWAKVPSGERVDDCQLRIELRRFAGRVSIENWPRTSMLPSFVTPVVDFEDAPVTQSNAELGDFARAREDVGVWRSDGSAGRPALPPRRSPGLVRADLVAGDRPVAVNVYFTGCSSSSPVRPIPCGSARGSCARCRCFLRWLRPMRSPAGSSARVIASLRAPRAKGSEPGGFA